MRNTRPHITDWTSMAHEDHFVELYESEEHTFRLVAEYLFHGMKHQGIGMAIATPEHLVKIADHFDSFGFDLERAVFSGVYLPIDAHELLAKMTVNGSIDADAFDKFIGAEMRRLSSHSLVSVRAFGEMVAILVAEGRAHDAIKLEILWNDLRGTCSFSLYCSYPLSVFRDREHGDLISTICAQHSQVLPGESYTSLADSKSRAIEVARLQHRCRLLEAELESFKSAPIPALRMNGNSQVAEIG